MVGWHHWLNGHELEQTPGDGEGPETWRPWVHKQLDTTERLKNFCLHRVFVAAPRLSLAAESGAYSQVAVNRLLTVVAPLVAEHRLWAHGLRSMQAQ